MTLIQFPLVTFIKEIRNSFLDTKNNHGKAEFLQTLLSAFNTGIKENLKRYLGW